MRAIIGELGELGMQIRKKRFESYNQVKNGGVKRRGGGEGGRKGNEKEARRGEKRGVNKLGILYQ